MSFISPDRLIWLWVALPIIGFYILKTRLRRRRVATLLFWDQLFEEKRQRTLWQNLRHWLSLLLQLIIVTTVVLALVEPTLSSRSDEHQELILIVDNSASMQAVDPATGRSRLEEALDEAADFAAGLRQGDHAALMTAGSRVDVVVGLTDYSPAIEEGLETIAPTDGPTRIEQAIQAARRLASNAERRRIVVFSDVCLPEPPEPEEDVRWIPVGSGVDNVAVTRFQARRSTVDPVGYALLIELQNFGEETAEGRLKLELGDSLVDVIPYTLAADESWRTTIDGTSREGGVLTASIDADDGLAADNVARAVIPSRPVVPVRLVTAAEDEAYYLRTVLESIPLLELIDGADPAADSSAETFTIFSETVPPTLPDGPILIVAPPTSGPDVDADGRLVPAWTVGEEIASPLIAKQHEESPLLIHVQLLNVLLDGGRDVQVNEALGQPTTLLETAEGAAVLVSVERPEGRMLILSADLDSSDLPLRIAFPVMMTNAVNWFLRRTNEINPALSTGETAFVPWDAADDEAGGDEAVLIDAGAGRRRVTVEDRRASVGPVDDVGVLGLFAPSSLPTGSPDDQTPPTPEELLQTNPETEGELIAVNLCNAQESDLRPSELPEQSEDSLPPVGLPAWLFLILGAIGLVLGEWALFNRRVVA